MLDLVSETHWADEQTNFFEPCCGIGSLLLPIFYRRVEFFEKKYVALGTSEPKIRAVANSIDTLWALDICEKNVETSRTLLFNAALDIVSNSQTIVRQSPVASRQSPVASRQSPV